ncbi:TNF receptor-associated factor 4-like [Macrosteles quadrilineatus]|uniref:TNF receptor-associated factor 4-like n=1 Tax=Macrosteles quadrilineatus TaxID=74068 RepID=UPI0023E2E431|nr:TNF receptor-associated factor 4-like [Macrosteles quadrilineatus]
MQDSRRVRVVGKDTSPQRLIPTTAPGPSPPSTFNPTCARQQVVPVSINGRLMWTISNFNARLEESKENKSQIESPCFYTSDCGYKLQLRAYLNGVGQWEGRHMIVSLHVLSSQWDNRLAWPCRMKVILCLRDQEQINRKAKDIMKSFTSSPAQKGFENPCLQMFIPHRTLYTRSYLKTDVVIIDVKTLPI